jgi:transposase
MYLPPYSPDLNLIEQLFAKALLDKAAARTGDSLWITISDALEAVTPYECSNYIRNSDYEPV